MIEAEDLKKGDIIRLGQTTSWMKGLVDKIVRVVVIDRDFCYVEHLDKVGKLSNHKSELKLSEWELDSVSDEYLQAYCPEDFWAETVEEV